MIWLLTMASLLACDLTMDWSTLDIKACVVVMDILAHDSQLTIANHPSGPAAKILIADDSDTDRLLLQTILVNQGHTVVAASDGDEAIELFRDTRPDMVFLDALMPRMNGFEAAEQIKILAGEEFVPIIFLTSLQSTDSLVRCLDAGGDDFLPKPYNRVILKAKIAAFSRMRDMHRTMQLQRDLITAHNDRLLREQEIAKRVFDKVAHSGCLNAKNIRYVMSPVAVFNGDIALAAVSPTGNLVVMLGDFTGHGLDAAIGAMPVAQSFYEMVEKGTATQAVLREIDQRLCEVLPIDSFCCAIVADINFDTGIVKIWNGGLPACALYRTADKQVIPLKSRHIPLGIPSSKGFDDSFETFIVQPDDRLFFWSDGLHEATNSDGEMFGEQRLMQVFEHNSEPEQLFDEINDAVAGFTAQATVGDDVSVVEVKIVAAGDFEVEHEELVGSDRASLSNWSLTYELYSVTLREYDPLPVLLHLLVHVPYLKRHGGNIYTILTELYSNALDHGLLHLNGSLKNSTAGFDDYYQQRQQQLNILQNAKITIQIEYKKTEDGGALCFTVEDTGDGFDYRQINRDLESGARYAGRGIQLLRLICDSLEYSGRGNVARACYSWVEG